MRSIRVRGMFSTAATADMTFDTYLAGVEEARKRGYAVDRSRYVKGVTTVSSTVLDTLNKPSC